MPTTLPERARASDPTADFVGFLRVLARMYMAIALVIAALVSLDAACGLFAGRTLAASIVIATGTDLPEPDNARIGFVAIPNRSAF
ncbi:MAG: hypothetical protein JO000_23515 [Alphaproteobacteria bacterium]|nr:hypothetical protein [Alphaproteobacteria bacterium]